MKVLTIMHNGFEELEAIGTLALLRRAGIECDITSFEGDKCTGRYNIEVSTIPFNNVNKYDYDLLFLPGGPHYAKILNNPKALELLKYYTENKAVAAICAGPTVLGKLGLLKGKNYTCFSSMNEDFGGNYIDTYSVMDGNIITGKSAAASIDFGFMIIKYLLGENKELEIKNQIYYFSK